jgi:hypothetical protein
LPARLNPSESKTRIVKSQTSVNPKTASMGKARGLMKLTALTAGWLIKLAVIASGFFDSGPRKALKKMRAMVAAINMSKRLSGT